MQTGWIKASRLAWDPTCLPLSLSLPIKNKQNLQVLKRRRQYNPFLENYPAFKGLRLDGCALTHTWIDRWTYKHYADIEATMTRNQKMGSAKTKLTLIWVDSICKEQAYRVSETFMTEHTWHCRLQYCRNPHAVHFFKLELLKINWRCMWHHLRKPAFWKNKYRMPWSDVTH